MKRAYASTPEGQIHYYNHGRGQPLLMLHETPRSAWSFAPLMRKLGKQFNCFAPDTLGFGMSDAPAPGTRMPHLPPSARRWPCLWCVGTMRSACKTA